MTARRSPKAPPPRPEHESLDEVLARLYVTATGRGQAFLNKDFASYFRISESFVSKVRTGELRMSAKQARKILERVRGHDEEDFRRLVDTRMHPPPSNLRWQVQAAPAVVPGVFETLSERAGSVAFMEYRDRPKTNASGPHADLANQIAAAIASGVTGAMFQPFGVKSSSAAGLGPHFADYVGNLILEVRQTYLLLLSRAADVLAEKMPRRTAIQEIKERFALYEIDGPVSLVSGLQTRLMYAEWMDEGELQQEIWDWVALPAVGKIEHADVVVKRDKERLPPAAVFEQFAPISTYFREYRRLPITDQEIADAYDAFASEADTQRRWVRWDG